MKMELLHRKKKALTRILLMSGIRELSLTQRKMDHQVFSLNGLRKSKKTVFQTVHGVFFLENKLVRRY